jgi:hypothetical protein
MPLEGVRVGPLDPDRGENFGQVGGQSTARSLVRHHMAMHPPALVAALSRRPHPERSDVLRDDPDLAEEVADAARSYYEDAGEALPEGAELSGFNVRGRDDAPKQRVVTFTWHVPVEAGGSGRSGKGFIPYDRELIPDAVAAGDEAVQIEKLKKAGQPWSPQVLARSAEIRGTGVERDDASADAQAAEDAAEQARREAEELRRQLDEANERLAAVEGQQPSVAQEAEEEADDDDEEDVRSDELSEQNPPEEPWRGYDKANADEVRKRLRQKKDVPEAERVLAYEQANANRGTVVSAANQILDRQPSQ